MGRNRILYIQHAAGLGGSALSLLLTAQHLDKTKYEPVVALVRPSETLIGLYRDSGIPVMPWPGIVPFDHCTGAYYSLRQPTTWRPFLHAGLHWKSSERKTIDLVNHICPKLVHLNSMALGPCATALRASGVPFVWHVREAPTNGVFGLRRGLISDLLRTCGSEVIFLSSADRSAWVADQRGVIVENFVADDGCQIDQVRARAHLDLRSDTPVVCYVGGLSTIKGIFPLLEAISIVRQSLPGLVCLMPGSQYRPTDRWQSRLARRILPAVGSGTLGQQVEQKVVQLGLTDTCVIVGFQQNIRTWLSASDLVVFPSIEAHFARPVIEAAFLGRPAVASNLPGVASLVDHGNTGLLVAPNDPSALARAIIALLNDRQLCAEMGRKAAAVGRERFSAKAGVKKIEAIYERILAGANPAMSMEADQGANA